MINESKSGEYSQEVAITSGRGPQLCGRLVTAERDIGRSARPGRAIAAD